MLQIYRKVVKKVICIQPFLVIYALKDALFVLEQYIKRSEFKLLEIWKLLFVLKTRFRKCCMEPNQLEGISPSYASKYCEYCSDLCTPGNSPYRQHQ